MTYLYGFSSTCLKYMYWILLHRCSGFKEASSDYLVFKKATLENLPSTSQTSYSKAKSDFLYQCEATGNLDATYNLGMVRKKISPHSQHTQPMIYALLLRERKEIHAKMKIFCGKATM